MSIAKHSARNYAWMMTLEVIKAVTLLVSIYLLRDEGRGLMALAYVIPNIVAIFAGLGLEVAAVYFIGKDESQAPKIASTALWSVLGIGVLFSGAIFAAYNLWPSLVAEKVSPLLRYLILAQLPLAMGTVVFGSIFVHRRWFAKRYMLEVLRRGMNVIGLAVIALLLFPDAAPIGLVETLAGFHLVVAITIFALAAYALRDWLCAKPSLTLFRKMLAFGWANSIAVSAMYLLNYGDQYLIDRVGSGDTVALVGVYTAAFALLAAVSGVSQSIASVMVRVSVEADQEESNRLVAEVGRRTALLMLIVAGFSAAAAPFGVMLLPVEFEIIRSILPILLISAPIFALSQMAEQVTINRGRMGLASIPPLFAVVANIGLNLWWIPLWGLYGAAWATVAGFSVLLIGRLLIARRLAGPEVVRELFAFRFDDFRFLWRKVVEILRRREAD